MKAILGICLFCMLVCNMNAGVLNEKTTYQVADVTRVISPLEFECKLKDYPYAKSARFKVQIQNLKLMDDATITDHQAALFLQEFFDKSDSIQLRNVKTRNYFRLSADVFVDNNNLARIYVENQLATLINPPKAAGPVRSSQTQLATTPLKGKGAAEASVNRFSTRPVGAFPGRAKQGKLNYVTVDDLLNTEVDLSQINDDTTLEEALDIISHSVRPNLPLVIFWNDLETNALIDRDGPIGISGFGQMRLGFALTTVLQSVSMPQSDLVLVPKDNVIVLGTKQSLQYKPTARVYSVMDLAALPSFANEGNRNFGSSGGGNSSSRSSRNSNSGSSHTR